MVTTSTILPGITLRAYIDERLKQNVLTVQLVRPMCREEASLNALLPAVLLRGCESAPDIRAITARLDDLYGASIGAQVRRIGDCQTTGFGCGFISDRFALEGDKILAPALDFLRELLLCPLLEDGVFRADFVESEKKNLITTLQSQKNDKRSYSQLQLLSKMCARDSYGVPRLGDVASVEAITPASLYAHYKKVLTRSPVELFYVGQPAPELPSLLQQAFRDLERQDLYVPVQTHFTSAGGGEFTETMDVAQGRLYLGYNTTIDLRQGDLAAMQVCNTLWGGGMTSKLFMQVREKMSLCYDIGSTMHSSKGIVTVSAGIDSDKDLLVRQQIEAQLTEICNGNITDEELGAAKKSLITSLQGTHDSTGSIENYYGISAISGLRYTPEAYIAAIEQVDKTAVAAAARTLTLDTVYFLKGEA